MLGTMFPRFVLNGHLCFGETQLVNDTSETPQASYRSPPNRIPSTRTPSTRTPSTRTPSTRTPSTRTPSTRTPSNRLRPQSAGNVPEPDRLGFLELDQWDQYNSYGEAEPTVLHYSIEWKVAVHNKVITKDTEQDVVLAPNAYWHMVLRSKLEKLLLKKFGANMPLQCDDTNVIVSVTDRTQRDLVKWFDELNIDWSVISKQLEEWGERFRSETRNKLQPRYNVGPAEALQLRIHGQDCTMIV
ncbi:hypothetical protein DM02DRAFT_734548 [Periconia macrospinosa]|uniref:Uncharacterized protein n=1 Tax=Periconia macrospinosa TaxID=97972 RepID=A0A2V1CXN6_9PLEO|nr:hypothetical protein DM02DRAFT_734548 [Periconia macrospinosa]